jgi:hypothetical protein
VSSRSSRSQRQGGPGISTGAGGSGSVNGSGVITNDIDRDISNRGRSSLFTRSIRRLMLPKLTSREESEYKEIFEIVRGSDSSKISKATFRRTLLADPSMITLTSSFCLTDGMPKWCGDMNSNNNLVAIVLVHSTSMAASLGSSGTTSRSGEPFLDRLWTAINSRNSQHLDFEGLLLFFSHHYAVIWCLLEINDINTCMTQYRLCINVGSCGST